MDVNNVQPKSTDDNTTIVVDEIFNANSMIPYESDPASHDGEGMIDA